MPFHALLIIVILTGASICRADDFYLILERSSFPAGSRESVYVRGTEALRVRQDGFNDEVRSAKRLMAEWSSVTLTAKDVERLRAELVRIGVKGWEKQYPDPSETILCDGDSFWFALQTSKIDVFSSGGCVFPDRFSELELLVDGIFK